MCPLPSLSLKYTNFWHERQLRRRWVAVAYPLVWSDAVYWSRCTTHRQDRPCPSNLHVRATCMPSTLCPVFAHDVYTNCSSSVEGACAIGMLFYSCTRSSADADKPARRGQRSLKVIWANADRSATNDFLLALHSNHEPIWYRFRDRRWFQSKIANFPTPVYLTPPPRWRSSPCNWVSTQGW